MLFSSLPLYWGEAADVGALLGPEARRHWAREEIERSWELRPIDTLDAAALARGRTLLMAQPRPLSPVENVALDDWVAQGGRLLLFADPALTADSAFAVGDRRRPQGMVLLSPILGRWGLKLEFDESQPLGERHVAVDGGPAVPVNLHGRFAPIAGGRGNARCVLEAAALVADCRVGSGRVLAIADAAIFETGEQASDVSPRRAALAGLLARAFAR